MRSKREGHTDPTEPTTQRLTVSDAADVLAITVQAVRSIKRGMLRSERRDSRDELIAQLRSEVEAWREEARRKNHLLVTALKCIAPQHEAQENGSEGQSWSTGLWSLLRDVARDEKAYSRFLVRVLLPTYLTGLLIVALATGVWAYKGFHSEDPALRLPLGAYQGAYLMVVWGFGVYAGVRDGVKFERFRWFACVGLGTALVATVVMVGVSIREQGQSVEILWALDPRRILLRGVLFISTYGMFAFGALFARTLARIAASEAAPQEEQSSGESSSSQKVQALVGLLGSIITALTSLFGLVQTFSGGGG